MTSDSTTPPDPDQRAGQRRQPPVAQVRGSARTPSSLHRILAPRAVAVVGAGPRHGEAGHEALRALRDYGYRGRLFAVNRTGRPVCGIPAYRAVSNLPAPVDLLILAVPERRIAGVLADAGPLGAHGAVLLDTDPLDGVAAGGRHRQEILQIARRQRIRLLGPASLGILNTDPAVRLNAALSPARPPTGGLALAVRSGAVGVALLADAVRQHCGVSTMVSLGDEIDITGADLLTHWLDDPATRAVALSPESFGEPGRFARLARALGRHKPVLAVAGPPSGDDLFARADVIRTGGLGETVDAARMLVDQPLPAGNRIAVVGNADGLTQLAAGTARAQGFHVVTHHFPAGSPYYPNSLGTEALPTRIAEAAETAAGGGGVDILLLVLVGTRANALAATVSALDPVLSGHPRLTVAAVVADGSAEVHRLGRRGAPVFREPEQAVRALAHARDYAAWRRDPFSGRPGPGHLDLRPESARQGRIAVDTDLRLTTTATVADPDAVTRRHPVGGVQARR